MKILEKGKRSKILEKVKRSREKNATWDLVCWKVRPNTYSKKQKKERKKGVKKNNYNTKTQIQLLKCFISCCPAQYTGYAVLHPNFALYIYISEYFIWIAFSEIILLS